MKLLLAGGILAVDLLSFGAPITSISGADAVYVVDNSGSSHIDEYTTAGVLVRTLSGGPRMYSFGMVWPLGPTVICLPPIRSIAFQVTATTSSNNSTRTRARIWVQSVQ
jgi:hypothetical protein